VCDGVKPSPPPPQKKKRRNPLLFLGSATRLPKKKKLVGSPPPRAHAFQPSGRPCVCVCCRFCPRFARQS
jgi:hypothetical protein